MSGKRTGRPVKYKELIDNLDDDTTPKPQNPLVLNYTENNRLNIYS